MLSTLFNNALTVIINWWLVGYIQPSVSFHLAHEVLKWILNQMQYDMSSLLVHDKWSDLTRTEQNKTCHFSLICKKGTRDWVQRWVHLFLCEVVLHLEQEYPADWFIVYTFIFILTLVPNVERNTNPVFKQGSEFWYFSPGINVIFMIFLWLF